MSSCQLRPDRRSFAHLAGDGKGKEGRTTKERGRTRGIHGLSRGWQAEDRGGKDTNKRIPDRLAWWPRARPVPGSVLLTCRLVALISRHYPSSLSCFAGQCSCDQFSLSTSTRSPRGIAARHSTNWEAHHVDGRRCHRRWVGRPYGCVSGVLRTRRRGHRPRPGPDPREPSIDRRHWVDPSQRRPTRRHTPSWRRAGAGVRNLGGLLSHQCVRVGYGIATGGSRSVGGVIVWDFPQRLVWAGATPTALRRPVRPPRSPAAGSSEGAAGFRSA